MDSLRSNMRKSHGLSFTFTSSQKSQYQDSSLTKTQKLSSLQKTHMQNLQKEVIKITYSKQHHQSLRDRLSGLKASQASYKAKLQESEETQKKQNKAAVIIQKHVRGFLLRRQIDDQWHDMKKARMHEMVDEVLSNRDKYMYSLGKLPDFAARIIQKAYRRRLFHKKIMRIKETYRRVLELKEQETFKKIRETLRNLYSVNFINFLKFERFRNKELQKIKKKLALLSIKKVFLREKITWKIVRIRIRKFKRNLKVPQRKINRRNTIAFDVDPKPVAKKPAANDKKPEIIIKKSESPENPADTLKNPASPRGGFSNTFNPTSGFPTGENNEKPEKTRPETPKNPEPEDLSKLRTPSQSLLLPSSSQESIVTTTTEKEAQIREELLKKLEEERKVKVSLGRISYNVRTKDETRLLPYLKTLSGNDPDLILLSPTSAKPAVLAIPPIREKPAEVPSFSRKPYVPGSYMKETQAFQNSRMDPSDLLNDEESPSVYVGKVRNNSTLMYPTAAFIQKTMGNPSSRSHSTETKTAEKLVLPSKKFRSNILLEIPEQPEKREASRKVPVLLSLKNKEKSIEKIDPPASNTFSNRVSISFDEALPEYSEFLQQYTKTPKRSKLEPLRIHKVRL